MLFTTASFFFMLFISLVTPQKGQGLPVVTKYLHSVISGGKKEVNNRISGKKKR